MKKLRAAALAALLAAAPAFGQTTQSGVGPAPNAPTSPPIAPLLGCAYMPAGVSITTYGFYGCSLGANGGINVNVLSGGGGGGGGSSAVQYDSAPQTATSGTTRAPAADANWYTYVVQPSGKTYAVSWASAQPINGAQINGAAIATGPGASSSGTQRIILATDQTTVPVSGTFFQNVQPISGAVTDNQGTPAAIGNAWPVYLTQGGAALSSTSGLPTTDTNAAQSFATPGTSASKAQGVQFVTGGLPFAVTGAFYQAVQPVSGTVNLGTLNGAALDSSVQAVKTALGSPLQAGGSVGISGTLPAFAATPTFNIGATNGVALDASVQAVKTALGSPFQAGASIGNTSFGVSGGPIAAGSTEAGNPVPMGGVDSGGLARYLSTDSTGRPVVVGATPSGSSIGTTYPVRIGGAYGTTATNAQTDSAGNLIHAPLKVASTVTPGTVTTASAFQTVLPSSVTRNGCTIVNTSTAVEYVYVGGGTATTTASFPLTASGGQFNCATPAGVVITDQLSLTSATASSSFVVVSQ